MNLPRLIRRLRLELDQTLRTRAFVSRAVRGLLRPEESLDLVAQLAFMLWAVGGEGSARLIELAGQDALRLGECALGKPPPPCAAVHFLRGLSVLSGNPLGAALGSVRAFDIAVSVSGTSWVANAAEAAAETASGRSEFLSELGRSGTRSLHRLDREFSGAPHDLESNYAFAELSRGLVLGVSSYLDNAWPAPIHTPRMTSRATLAGPREAIQ